MLANGRPGVVRYVGMTKFATGDWVGVELDAPGEALPLPGFVLMFRTHVVSNAQRVKMMAQSMGMHTSHAKLSMAFSCVQPRSSPSRRQHRHRSTVTL